MKDGIEKDLSEAAKELCSEPTIHETEDKCLPNGQGAVSYPEGFRQKIKRRQYMQEKGKEIGLV